MRLSSPINWGLNWVKWPLGLAMMIVLPGAVTGFGEVYITVAHNPEPFWPLMAGLAGYVVAWRVVLGKRWAGSAFSTLEHELTHALFAILTLHPVVGIRATWSRGGHTQFRGSGNWLIYLSPYFFPTISVFLVALRLVVPESAATGLSVAIGASIGYHILSTWRETHPGQTDFQKAGRTFSFLFLPGANLLSYGFLLSAVVDGWTGASQYAQTTVRHTLQLLGL